MDLHIYLPWNSQSNKKILTVCALWFCEQNKIEDGNKRMTCDLDSQCHFDFFLSTYLSFVLSTNTFSYLNIGSIKNSLICYIFMLFTFFIWHSMLLFLIANQVQGNTDHCVWHDIIPFFLLNYRFYIFFLLQRRLAKVTLIKIDIVNSSRELTESGHWANMKVREMLTQIRWVRDQFQ